MIRHFSREEVYENAVKYFNGDTLAANVWTDKYALKDGNGRYYELTPDDMHHRLANEFFRIESEYPNPISKEVIYSLLKNFKYVVPQGSPMAGIGNNFVTTSLSNCFVLPSPLDSYSGIMRTDEEQVQIMKRRGGVGHDLSTLRAKGMLANGSILEGETGATLYMHRYSNSTREVSQSKRRGALMLSMSVKHPDADRFINMKVDNTKVTGANISVKLDDEFMHAVINDENYVHQFPIDAVEPEFIKINPAKKLWDNIIHNAWAHAEPGVLFWDNVLKESPARGYGDDWKEISTNPCSELPLPPYDSCRLLAINLYSYVDKPFTPDATFNFNKFIKHVELAQRLMDDLVNLEIEKINKIITKIESDPEPDDIKYVELNLWKNILQKAILGRRTGLGITAEGDMLAALGLRYGTDQAIEFATLVHKTMAMASYRSSINLAKERGSFPIWNYESDLKSDFINRMIGVFNDEDPAVIDDWKKYGRRNIANLTIAPTGSISLLTRTTSGIEPLFLPFYKRRRKTEDPSKSVFKDEVGDMWEEYLVIHPKFEDWYRINYKDGKPMSEMSSDELTELFKMSPYYKSTSEDVDYYGKIKMQGSIQKYVDHSISMTTNIPESSPKSLVADLYMLAWKYGCKGATVYRSGSRSGVLVSVNNKSTDEFDYVNAAKRPKELPCNVHTIIANGKKHNVFVGLLNDKPYEIFITDYFTNEKNLVIKKLGRGKYNLLKDGKLYVANLTSDMSDEQEAITRLISTSLRHRADIKFIVEQLLKTRGNILSFSKVLARTLKQYIPDGASSTLKCSECGSSNVVFEEGCNKCNDCGGSKCG